MKSNYGFELIVIECDEIRTATAINRTEVRGSSSITFRMLNLEKAQLIDEHLEKCIGICAFTTESNAFEMTNSQNVQQPMER